MAALSGLRNREDQKPRPELPIGLRSQPSGAVAVPAPADGGAWEEVFRDFARVLQGDSVFVIGRQRLYPIRGPSQTGVDEAARGAAFDALARALREELRSQGHGLSAAGQVLRPGWRNAHCTDDAPDAEVDEALLRELALQVAANVSVSTGVQVALAKGLPPSLWQPCYTVCVGEGQVRVLTFAFVGEPVIGDRPDRKRTPFCLRIATGNLVQAAAAAALGRRRREAKVWYAAEATSESVQTTLDYIVGLEEELFGAVEHGHWRSLAGEDPVDFVDGLDGHRGSALRPHAGGAEQRLLGPRLPKTHLRYAPPSRAFAADVVPSAASAQWPPWPANDNTIGPL